MGIRETRGTIDSIPVNTIVPSIDIVTKTDTDNNTMTSTHGDRMNVSATVWGKYRKIALTEDSLAVVGVG
jgi:hypothetical protein